MGELDALFNDKVESEPAQAESEVVEPTTTEVKTETAVDEKPQESEKAEKSEIDAQEAWTKKAALDERRKRQEKERELDQVRKELEELRKNQFGKREEHQPDIFDDPKGFEDRIRQDMRQEMSQYRTEMSRNMMLQMHEDYEEAELKFFDIAKENPFLRQQAAMSDHPAKFVYDTVKKHDEFQQLKDGTLKEKLRAEVRKELEEEMRTAQSQKASKVANLSPSLANESSSDKRDTQSITRVDQLFAR